MKLEGYQGSQTKVAINTVPVEVVKNEHAQEYYVWVELPHLWTPYIQHQVERDGKGRNLHAEPGQPGRQRDVGEQQERYPTLVVSVPTVRDLYLQKLE